MESQQPHIVIKDTLEGVGEGNLANIYLVKQKLTMKFNGNI